MYLNALLSYLLEKDYYLKSKLSLSNEVFKLVLNEERMKNLAIHREIFYQKEKERKMSK